MNETTSIWNKISIICAFYNTPHLIEPFLKSFVYHHPQVQKFNILVTDNSTNEESQGILGKYNIPRMRNPGNPHSPSIDLLFEKVKTKYALLCDSDILIQKSLNEFFDMFFKNNLDILCSIQGSRGGYQLYDRIDPSFVLINLDRVKERYIKFHDQKRIDETGSNGFYGNIPLQYKRDGKFFDVGSTFLMDCIAHNFKIGRLNKRIDEFRFHSESGSWTKDCGVPGYVEMGKQRTDLFMEKAKQFENVNIEGKFKYE